MVHTDMTLLLLFYVVQIFGNVDINSPLEYIAMMKAARPKQPYTVHNLDYSFFLDFEKLTSNFASIRPGKRSGDPVVTDIRALCYQPTGNVQYKLRHCDEWAELPCRRSALSRAPKPKQLYGTTLKISADKFKHLQELKEVIDVHHHGFYDALAHD